MLNPRFQRNTVTNYEHNDEMNAKNTREKPEPCVRHACWLHIQKNVVKVCTKRGLTSACNGVCELAL